MELRPWTVSLFSTAYDLKESRKEIIKRLSDAGMLVSAFEEPNFPVEPNLHYHDTCLVALQRADIALVIIDKRSGGQYYSQDNKTAISITRKEYREALNKGIPMFAFVSESTWNERYEYKKKYAEYCKEHEIKENKKSKEAFDKNYKCSYVQNVATIDFVEDIQKAYKNNKVSNWIERYENLDDLIQRIEGKLRGYSRKLLERLSESQNKTLLSRHTSTAFGMTLGDVFDSDYYVDPPYIVESGKFTCDKETLSEMIESATPSGESVLIHGEAGYGKTTILARCFTSCVKKQILEPQYEIPLLLTLKDKGNDYHFEVEKYIEEEFAKALDPKLRHKSYPYLDLSQIHIRFYCDGFDELAEKLTPEDLSRIKDSEIFSYPLLLTCRQQFAYRYLNDSSFSDKFAIRIHMNNWSKTNIKAYIHSVCVKAKDSLDESAILSELDRNNIYDILNSPLLVSMYMWYMGRNRTGINTMSRVLLFRTWLIELANRERQKSFSGLGLEKEAIFNLWAYVAWLVYREKNVNNRPAVFLEDVKSTLNKCFPSLNAQITSSCLEALFECDDDRIYGTFHEQFMEFLSAQVMFDSCIGVETPYPEFLELVVRPEINRYFREIWIENSDNHRGKVFNSLRNAYISNLEKQDNAAILIRVHAVYHLSRLKCNERADFLKFAFGVEKNASVILSLFFGAIKMGWLDKENEFCELLKRDPAYNEANRGYHLAYYSDLMSGDTLPFGDDCKCVWQGTLKAFQRHFSSEEKEHFFLRRIDLLTMCQLIEARKRVEPMTDELMERFETEISNCSFAQQPEYEDYAKKIQEEFLCLKSLYSKYK